MRTSQLLRLFGFGLRSILLRRHDPILGTIILTDACNLACRHCAVSNLGRGPASYRQVRQEMEAQYRDGIRILFFYGGETLLWQDEGRTVRELLVEARQLGFFSVNLVTNGTLGLRFPEADVVFLSLDGLQPEHDAVRGAGVFARVLARLAELGDETNVCVYTALNRLNWQVVPELVRFVAGHPRLGSISFNFHTPYPGTEELTLDAEQKAWCVARIQELSRAGAPIFNLPSQLERYLSGRWPRPCPQCVVWDEGRRYVCGRCVEIEGLCQQCGYLFALEFSQLFAGNPRAILDMLRHYTRHGSPRRRLPPPGARPLLPAAGASAAPGAPDAAPPVQPC